MSRHLRRRAALVVLILLASFTGLGAITASAATGTLTGHFTDNGVPVGGAQVTVLSSDFSFFQMTTTDPDGGYRFGDIPTADYRLSFGLAGFTQYAHQKLSFEQADLITVGSTGETVVDETVVPHGSMSGRVTRSDGSPLAYGQVTAAVRTDNSGLRLFMQADGDGRYSLPIVPAGEYIVSFQEFFSGPIQYAHQKVNFEEADRIAVTAGTAVTLDEAFLPLGGIAGKLTDQSGQPVQGAYVSLQGELFAGSAITGPDGSYRISAFPGQYRVFFQLPNGLFQYAHQKQSFPDATVFTVTAGPDLIVDEQTIPTGTVAGRLTDTAGNPVAGANVTVSNATTFQYGSTDQDGRYQVEVFAGTYRVAFSGPTGTQWAHGKSTAGTANPIAVTAGQTTFVDDRLAPTGSIRITAVDAATNRPIAAFCASVDIGFSPFQCTDNGTIEVPALPGRYSALGYVDDPRYLVAEQRGIIVTSGNVTSVEFRLVLAATIRTTVRDAATGAPVQGACVEAVEPLNPISLAEGNAACSDADGAVTLTGLRAGTYNLFAWSHDDVHGHQWVGLSGGTGAQVTSRLVTVAAGGTATVPPVRLDKAGKVSGVISDAATGQPLHFAFAGLSTFSDGGGPGAAQTFTDANGRYTFSGLGPYAWTFVFGTGGYATEFSGRTPNRFLAKGVPVTAGATTAYNVGLRKGATVSAQVVGPNGEAVDSARITVVNALSGDEMGSGDCAGPDRCTIAVFGPQLVKLGYNVNVNGEQYAGFYVDAGDFLHATPVVVPSSGTRSVTIVARRLFP